jgi:putative DNA methylase
VDGDAVVCPLCDGRTSVGYVKEEGVGGRLGAQLLAVLGESDGRRTYRTADGGPEELDYTGVQDVLTESLPTHALGFRVQPYGFRTWASFFTPRQLALMKALVDALPTVRQQMEADGATPEYADVLQTYLAFLVDRIATRNSAFSFWNPGRDTVEAATSNNYMRMVWTFAEANPFADASGGALGQLRFLVDAIVSLPSGPPGKALQLDATKAMPVDAPAAFCTDPPYFDNIPYADLSDFYYVWVKRTVGGTHPNLFSTILTPKEPELVADATRHGDAESAAEFFRQGFRTAFDLMARTAHPDVPIVIYYALRQRESTDAGGVVSTGWERMLQGLVDAGLMITSTWPFRTEQRGGLRSHGRNALASSVVIACRPRLTEAPVATLGEFLAALRTELAPAMKVLQHGGIAAVDLDQAAIGPGMTVFSRYARVVGADGRPITVRKALELINKALDEIREQQEGDLDVETRFAVSWFSEFGTDWRPFGRAEDLARAKNVAVDGLVEAGIAVLEPGRVRLRRSGELEPGWDPATDPRLTVWEVTHHLLRALNEDGERGAASLARRVGALGDIARDLAYRLYTICERRKWAQEALAYNSLVVAWPEIARLVAGEAAEVQETLLEE